MKNVICCPISDCKLKNVIPSQTSGNLRSFWLKDESKKSDITLSLTQNSIYFQMNQKSYAGANCLGFKMFQERGNHNCRGEGSNSHSSNKNKTNKISPFYITFGKYTYILLNFSSEKQIKNWKTHARMSPHFFYKNSIKISTLY